MKFRKIVSAALVLLFIFTPVFTTVSFADDAKPISSYEDFLDISKDLKGDYYLTCDISVPSGEEFKPLGSETALFDGTLDGKGYSIKGLNIIPAASNSKNSYYSGLFYYNRGTVKNLKVVDASVNSKNAKYLYSGIICGINLGTIENCYVSGMVFNNGISFAGYTGAVCGQMLRGKIKNTVSYANVYSAGGEQLTGGIVGAITKGNIENTATYGSIFANGVNASRDIYLGGIVGDADKNTTFKNCLFAGGLLGEKSADIYLGGIAGRVKGKIEKSISYGSITPSEVTSHTYIGGITGDDYVATVTDAYYLKNILNEKSTESYAVAIEEKDFLSTSSFKNIDFGTVWQMAENGPVLNNLPKPPSSDAVATLSGITITSKPKKLTYTQGDQTLDLTGLKVVANYGSSSVELSKNQYTVGGYNYILSGKQTITVTYKGFSDTFEITVKKTDKPIISIGTLTEGSYSDGTANGVISDKDEKNETTSSKKTDSKQNTSNTQIAENTVKDNMEEDDLVIDNNASSKPAKTKGTSPVILIVIVVLALFVGAVITILVFRFKPVHAEGEIHESVLKEEEYDDADVYK